MCQRFKVKEKKNDLKVSCRLLRTLTKNASNTRRPLSRAIRLAALAALLALALAGCGGNGGATSSGPTPDPTFTAIAIVSTQTHLLGSDVSVVGTVKNG